MSPRRRSTLAGWAPILAVVALQGATARAQVAPKAAPPSRGADAPKDPAVKPAAAAPKPAQGAGASIPRATDDPAMARKMDDLLQKWSAQSKLVNTLSVKYTRVDDDPIFDVKKEFTGQAKLQRNDLVYLDFNEVKKDQPKAVFDERIVCDGAKVYQFRGATKQVFVYPLPKNARDKALNQGALPFLFDMNVAGAKERYRMEFKAENKASCLIQIIPLLAIDREEYSQALVQLSKDTFLPERIQLRSPNGKETKTFVIATAETQKNAPIAASWFDGEGMTAGLVKNSGWKRIDNPDQGPPPAQGAPAVGARPAAPGRPAATKGQGGAVRQR